MLARRQRGVFKTVMKSEVDIHWSEMLLKGAQSINGAIQLFSDKPQISMSTEASRFYLVHVKLLKFSEKGRWQHDIKGRSIVVCLLVVF